MIQLFREGKEWCAVMPDFVNLQESPSGIGSDPDAAIASLVANVTRDAAECRRKAAEWERISEQMNYRGHNPPEKRQGAFDAFKQADAKADESRERLRLLKAIIDPDNTVEKQVLADLAALESLNDGQAYR